MMVNASVPPLAVVPGHPGEETSARDVQRGKAAFWDAIFRVSDDVDKLVRRVVAQLPALGGTGLLTLHDELRVRLERLRFEISDMVPDSERLMLILVFYFDERVMLQLPDTARLRWTPLQIEWLGSSHGGAEFYRILDKLIQDERISSLVFEVYYYCLNNGFVGRYAGNPDAIDAYKNHVKARIPVPEATPPAARESVQHGPLPRQWRGLWYYLGTASIVIALAVSITMLSNC